MTDRPLRRLLHPLTRRLETTVHPLRYLFVEITQRCNLKCRHCGSDCGAKPRPGELSTEEWLRLFAYLGERAPRDRMVLVITGGEPLCHPELDRILEGLGENQLTWGMVTNGHALSEARVSQLLAAGISSITVSLDGLQRSHDWLRGVEGAFERATGGLRRLAAAGLLFLDVVTCVNPRNLDELPRVMALLRELGVPAWRLFSIFPRGRARELQSGGAGGGSKTKDELQLSAGQLQRMLGFITDARQQLTGAGSDFQLSFSCEGYLPWALDGQVRDEPYFCRAGISIGSVLCDGAISACPNIPRSLVQGNVRSDDLMEVWEQRFEPFRQREWMRTGPCVDCGEWRRCLGNSMHLWDDEAGQTSCCTFECAMATR